MALSSALVACAGGGPTGDDGDPGLRPEERADWWGPLGEDELAGLHSAFGPPLSADELVDENPNEQLYALAEWEPVGAVSVAASGSAVRRSSLGSFAFVDLVTAIAEAGVWVDAIGNAEQFDSMKRRIANESILTAARLSSSTRHIDVGYPMSSLWARDFGPITARRGNRVSGEFVFVDSVYNYSSDRQADHVVDAIKLVVGREVVRSGLALEGGNFMVDGMGTCLVTQKVFDDNRALVWSEVRARFTRYFGCTNLITLPSLSRTVGHIDEMAKFLPDRSVVVGQVPDESALAGADGFLGADAAERATRRRELDDVAQLLADDGFVVRRVPVLPPVCHWGAGRSSPSICLGDEGHAFWRSYANALFIVTSEGRKTLLVPSFAATLPGGGSGVWAFDEENQVRKVYERFLPGYHVVLVNSEPFMSINRGSIHCLTMGYPL